MMDAMPAADDADDATATAEHRRITKADSGSKAWRAWGPYVAERAWGTVREDYSEHGNAWSYFPHDHARSRVYRWNEDAMAGVCDEKQTFCFGLALWNGADTILKERMFGLSGDTGNHGEDVKEYYWYEDSTPTHSWMRWRYHYPQAAFPYRQLTDGNAARGRRDPEYELVDTGVFDEDRYWAVTVDYAKADVADLCMVITVMNRGPDDATLHVLPTLWFRNTWRWGNPGRAAIPTITATDDGRLVAQHEIMGGLVLAGDDAAGRPVGLACDNENNAQRLWGRDSLSEFPKDGINDHVVNGAATVNPAGSGTKAALHYVVTVPAGGSAEIRLRLASSGSVPGPSAPDAPRPDLGDGFAAVMAARAAEADEFFGALIPAGTSPNEAALVRSAISGLMWGKQYYHFDVDRWLSGDPGSTPPPGHRDGRNAAWWHVHAADVISMPDPWEYPWFAAWDLAFHCVAIARVDPWFAKQQLLLMLRDWYLHPDGRIPAYEWAFGDVNPPVHAWAALRVFDLDGGTDVGFLSRVMHKLLLNFTWWVNRKDLDGNNVFEGGFLGLDNVGPFDRSAALPVAGNLQQSDATGWMGMYALNLLEIALRLARHDHAYEDIATKFFEHFAYIGKAAEKLWDNDDQFYCDVLRLADGQELPMRIFSVVGLVPLYATASMRSAELHDLPDLEDRISWFLRRKPEYAEVVGVHRRDDDGDLRRLLSLVAPEQLPRILARVFDEGEFLSPYGVRSLSRVHAEKPFVIDLDGQQFTVDYEPGESRTATFGGNSNWRGPIWMPVNYMLIGALREYEAYLGDQVRFEYPTGSGQMHSLGEIVDNLSTRLVALFLPGPDGRRPIFGDCARLATHPDWKDRIIFPEYFHGDTGAGLGASHQTGWTALVATLILSRNGHHPPRIR
jgi:hypothetical protein